MVNHSEGEYVNRKGNHINGLEGFLGYLKRQLSSRGGIRKKESLFSTNIWRYNKKIINRRKNLAFLKGCFTIFLSK